MVFLLQTKLDTFLLSSSSILALLIIKCVLAFDFGESLFLSDWELLLDNNKFILSFFCQT